MSEARFLFLAPAFSFCSRASVLFFLFLFCFAVIFSFFSSSLFFFFLFLFCFAVLFSFFFFFFVVVFSFFFFCVASLFFFLFFLSLLVFLFCAIAFFCFLRRRVQKMFVPRVNIPVSSFLYNRLIARWMNGASNRRVLLAIQRAVRPLLGVCCFCCSADKLLA